MNCKLCGSSQLAIYQHTAKCRQCGLLLYYPYLENRILLPKHDDESIRRYQAMFQKWQRESSFLNHHNLSHKFQFAIDRNHQNNPRLKILDYGAGGGQFALICKSYLFDCIVYSVDINDYALLDEYRPMVNHLKYEELPRDHTQFDYIFLNDVLEHVNDPIGVLQLLVAKLNPGGKIFIDTPKQFWIYPITKLLAPNLYCKVLKATVTKAHLQIWTRKSFLLAVKNAGLTIEKYQERPEFTLRPDFYLNNMGVKSGFVKFLGRLLYKCALWLVKNKIYCVVKKQL